MTSHDREKIEEYLRFLTQSCWKNKVSNFRLGQFGKVEPFCDLYRADVDINNINSLDNSGSSETVQKVLVSIV